MTEQPAKHLARLKVTFPMWSLRRAEEGSGFTGHRLSGQRVWAQSLSQLESRLAAAERKVGHDQRS